jgi:hypothetical protein
MGISPGRRCAERSSAVEKLLCEGTPDLVHEFLAFVASALSARLNFGKDLLPRGLRPLLEPFPDTATIKAMDAPKRSYRLRLGLHDKAGHSVLDHFRN